MFRFFYILLAFFLLIPPVPASEYQSIEIRAVWLTTNWQLDWPQKGKTVEEQKQELIDILDQLQAYNFNLVLFQVRAQGDAFYNSKTMGKSKYFNTSNNFDPLAFAVEECHKRQMECHAWMTTFPVEKISKKKMNKPDYYKKVNGYWYLDPARPETHILLKNIVAELVENYDIDGIHFDYIRYPDRAKWIDDSDSYIKYGKNYPKDIWRRQNINNLVSSLYDLVKEIKPWVQVSSSVIGKSKKIQEADHWTGFDDLSQDAVAWMQSGKHDLVFPMMYYSAEDFKRHYDYWVANSDGKYIIPGIGLYKIDDVSSPISETDIVDEIKYLEKNKSTGVAFFRVGNLLAPNAAIKKYLNDFYPYPAKLPPLYWLDDEQNFHKPILGAYINKAGRLKLEWDSISEDYTYNIYVSDQPYVDINNPQKLILTNYRGNTLEIEYDKGEYGMYYYITSSNRYHTESELSEPVYFYHSNTIYK